MNIGDKVFVFDPKRESIYECVIKDIIKNKNGENFAYKLTPSNSHLPDVTLSSNHVFHTFVEAFQKSLE